MNTEKVKAKNGKLPILGVMLSFLQIINHKLGKYFGEQPPQKVSGNLIIMDCTKEDYKKLICFCSPKLPCHCITVIPLKKWRGLICKYGA